MLSLVMIYNYMEGLLILPMGQTLLMTGVAIMFNQSWDFMFHDILLAR